MGWGRRLVDEDQKKDGDGGHGLRGRKDNDGVSEAQQNFAC